MDSWKSTIDAYASVQKAREKHRIQLLETKTNQGIPLSASETCDYDQLVVRSSNENYLRICLGSIVFVLGICVVSGIIAHFYFAGR